MCFTVSFKCLSVFQHVESSGGQCMGCRFSGEESLAHYSPWSCGTIGPCLSPFEPETLTHSSAHSCSEHSVRLFTHPKAGADILLKTNYFSASVSVSLGSHVGMSVWAVFLTASVFF